MLAEEVWMRVFRMIVEDEEAALVERGAPAVGRGHAGAEPPEQFASYLELQKWRLKHTEDAYPHDLPLTIIRPLALEPGIGNGTTSRNVSWAVQALRADRSSFDGEGVAVAVLDSGVALNHQAFRGLVISNDDCFNFVPGGDETDVSDDIGHGTLCASVAVGRAVNRLRIGVAPGVSRLIVGKVMDRERTVGAYGITKAIRWAYNRGAQIIAMSLGLDVSGIIREMKAKYGFDDVLATRIAADEIGRIERGFDVLAAKLGCGGAQPKGALIIAAAGNDSKLIAPPGMNTYLAPTELPASASNICSVAASTREDRFAPTSSGPADWAAPGVEVCGAQFGTTASLVSGSGSSLACGAAAGVAALWWQRELERSPQATVSDVKVSIERSLRPIPEPLRDVETERLLQAPFR